MQPANTQTVVVPNWKSPSIASCFEVSWKNALRWLSVALLLLFGLGCISAGAKHYQKYRERRLSCEQNKVPLPTYEQLSSGGSLPPEYPPVECLRKNANTTVTLDCSCYAGVSWTAGSTFTAIGVMLLLLIMIAVTDRCCCCFSKRPPAHPLQNVMMAPPPGFIVAGVPAGRPPPGYSSYQMSQLQRGEAMPGQHMGMPQMYAQNGTHLNPYSNYPPVGYNNFSSYQGNMPLSSPQNSQDFVLSVPHSNHRNNDLPMDVHAHAVVIGLPTSPPPKGAMPYRDLR